MHTVFINDHTLRFINAYDRLELERAKDHVLVSEHDQSMDELISRLENDNATPELFYLSENPDASWSLFLSKYTLVEASGGLVQNRNGEFLVILRLGKWDLPKGKIEYDESPEQAAIREVEEECGIDGLSILKKLPLTFHTYSLKKKKLLKKTNWFHMETASSVELIPQTEEDISEVRWMNQKEIQETFLRNTYASIAGLLSGFFK